jgi:hypothetical protein
VSLKTKQKPLQGFYFLIILGILKTNTKKRKKVNVLNATKNLVPKTVQKDMKRFAGYLKIQKLKIALIAISLLQN